MIENDLEQGSLSPSFTPRKGSFGTAVSNSLESAAFLGNAKATNGPIGSTLSDCFYEAENDSIIGVPRRKVEQLMRLWVDVFQQSLKQVDDENPETPQSTAIPIRQSPEPKLLNTIKGSPSPNISDYLSGIPSLTNINVMSDVEIEVENNSRRSVCDQWRSDEKAIHLEDCWKYIWEPKPGVDRGLFQWSCPEEKRKALQLDLIDALNGQSDDLTVALYMRKDFRSIATWVSLVGLRLNEIYRSFYGSPQITPAIQIEILIECLWACNQFRPVLGVRQDLQGPTVGDVLSSCYKRRVLEHPSPNQLLGSLMLRQHYQYIYTAVYLINILYAHRLPQFEKTQRLSETWNMLLSRVEASLRQAPDNSELDEGKDAFFSIDDFNLKDLQYIGNLQIRWTCYWDEHLQLETSSTGNILKIYWFQPSLARYLVQK